MTTEQFGEDGDKEDGKGRATPAPVVGLLGQAGLLDQGDVPYLTGDDLEVSGLTAEELDLGTKDAARDLGFHVGGPTASMRRADDVRAERENLLSGYYNR